MDFYNIFAILIVLTAAFAYINYKFLKLPSAIGLMLISVIFSFMFVLIGNISPWITEKFTSSISKIDFGNFLMSIMLSFMLFAGSINIDAARLKNERLPVMVFATAGVLLSTVTVGSAMYFVLNLFSLGTSYINCLLFGALISPTDPIAVMGILRHVKIPDDIEVKITGESLFNDGVAIVLFVTLFHISTIGAENLSAGNIILLFLREAGGGILFGFILGYAGFLLIRSIDNYMVEVFITLALVMGGYSLAHYLHISGPLSMVVTGLIIGNRGRKLGMSATTREYLNKFWEIIDDLLNAVLFILIGFEILLISLDIINFELGIMAFIIILLARYISVAVSMYITKFKKTFDKGNLIILTWGGLRGGISVALALSLYSSMHRDIFLPITYVVVLLSIIVQGLTIEKVTKYTLKKTR